MSRYVRVSRLLVSSCTMSNRRHEWSQLGECVLLTRYGSDVTFVFDLCRSIWNTERWQTCLEHATKTWIIHTWRVCLIFSKLFETFATHTHCVYADDVDVLLSIGRVQSDNLTQRLVKVHRPDDWLATLLITHRLIDVECIRAQV